MIDQPTPALNGYIAFYNRKQVEVYADTKYHAILKAAQILKVRDSQRYMIEAILAEKNGEEVTHLPLF